MIWKSKHEQQIIKPYINTFLCYKIKSVNKEIV